MKRSALLRHLRKHGCCLKRQGRSHSLWYNPQTGVVEAIPRHSPRSLRNSLERSVEDCQFLNSRGSNSIPGGHLLLAAQLLNGPNLLVPIVAGGS